MQALRSSESSGKGRSQADRRTDGRTDRRTDGRRKVQNARAWAVLRLTRVPRRTPRLEDEWQLAKDKPLKDKPAGRRLKSKGSSGKASTPNFPQR